MVRSWGRRSVVSAVLAGVVLVGAGCTQTTAGSAVRAVPPLVVGSQQVSDRVGAELANITEDRVPPPRVEVDPAECAVPAGPSTVTVYSAGWTQYHLVTMQEAADFWEHSVTQTAGKYPDEAAAKKVFDALNTGLAECTGRATVTDALDESTAVWTFAVDSTDGDATRWIATQADGNDWACYREARLTGQWVVQVAVCQVGNGRPAATSITEALVKKVTAT